MVSRIPVNSAFPIRRKSIQAAWFKEQVPNILSLSRARRHSSSMYPTKDTSSAASEGFNGPGAFEIPYVSCARDELRDGGIRSRLEFQQRLFQRAHLLMPEPLHAGKILSFGHRGNQLIVGERLGQIFHALRLDHAGRHHRRFLRGQDEILDPAAALPESTQLPNEGRGIPIRGGQVQDHDGDLIIFGEYSDSLLRVLRAKHAISLTGQYFVM